MSDGGNKGRAASSFGGEITVPETDTPEQAEGRRFRDAIIDLADGRSVAAVLNGTLNAYVRLAIEFNETAAARQHMRDMDRILEHSEMLEVEDLGVARQ